jgi:activator of 2-hydroxyglutaryl-CoA dehydratase
VASVTTTGYCEDLAQSASTPTTAWWRLRRTSLPPALFAQLDFIIDIGGQDMKCFKSKRAISTSPQ